MILPGGFRARQCCGCPTRLNPDTPRTVITALRVGTGTVMLIELCNACANARLGDMRCVNMSRSDASDLWKVFATGAELQQFGGGHGG